MSDEYVVRVDDVVWEQIYGSVTEADQMIDEARMGVPFVATIHKLGPAIEPPEPREWVVVDGGRLVHNMPTTHDSARCIAYGNPNRVVMRLVEDEA